MEKTSQPKKKYAFLKPATIAFMQLSLCLLTLLFVLSGIEILYNGFSHEFPKNALGVWAWAIFLDFVFWIKWLIAVYLAFILLYWLKPKLAKISFLAISGVLFIIQLSLIKYFNTSLLPLGSDLYGYSLQDIKQTVGASGGISIFYLLLIIGFLIIAIFALLNLPTKLKIPYFLHIILLIISGVCVLFALFSDLNTQFFSSDYANNLSVNKTDYFISSSYQYLYNTDNEVDIYSDNYIGDYGDASEPNHIAYHYLDEAKYPFYKSDSSADVLSPFFKPTQTPPHIVILLVEGLGRAFTNEGAYLGNFTPFIDSLSNQSLYWKNFLSEGGRTFAVLPSLLGSLPFAKNGFLEMGSNMPKHLSLLSLLKLNGYHTSFYYGGNSSFDNMSMFLKNNGIDEINDEKTFPSGYQKLPSINGFTWGYNDKELFRYYLNSRKNQDKPQLSVVLTVATHDPFRINEQDKYLKRFESRMQELAFDENSKQTYRNYKYQYASILYTDDALKNFFAEYKKRQDFKETIFLITGDHRMPEIPMSNKIDRYHVPLIVYSPMLKRKAQFASVSTHFDITPSLLAYLTKIYGIKTPRNQSWLGAGLDTSRQFRNIHQYPLIQTKTDMIDFVKGEYHLNGNTLYKLNSDMGESVIEDEDQVNQVKGIFEQFKIKNNKIYKGNAILPDSVLNKFNR